MYVLSRGHRVVAIDRTAGRTLWEAQAGAAGDENPGTRVAVADDVVVAGDYDLVGIDRDSGARRWAFAPPDGYGAGLYVGAIVDGVVFTGSPVGRAYAVEARTGSLRWSTMVAGERDARTTVFPPVADGRVVLVRFTTFEQPASGGVAAVERSTGRLVWRWEFPAPPVPALGSASAGGPIVAGGVVIAARSDGALYALDLENGRSRWSIASDQGARAASMGFQEFRSMKGLGDWFVAGSLAGPVTAYSALTRERLWQFITADGSVGFGMTANARSIFVPYLSGVIVALDPESGREQWRLGDWRIGFTSPPATFGNCVYLSSATTGFYAYCQEMP